MRLPMLASTLTSADLRARFAPPAEQLQLI